ncbi:hypothetical protein GCM10022289_10490 [Pedobacter jeongneungensis]|uniref:Dual-action HEIGH metallo-peptidase n=1 Tax=Pedobacter jeongneungensis TaxID=947309 RepID=A0ABP8B799_9SPHI
MKKIYYAFFFLITILSACKKDNGHAENNTEIPIEIIQKLKAAGFDTTEGLHIHGDGYIVEGDILLTKTDIDGLSENPKSKVILGLNVKDRLLQSKDPIGHYVSNLLTANSGVKNISIYINPSFQQYIIDGLDLAIARYNALEFGLTFSRSMSSSSADITISTTFIDPNNKPSNVTAYLMASGLPSNGNPYNQILVNTYYYNTSSFYSDIASTFAHEIGHAIGFRHTDYMNRAFSCGQVTQGNNEGGNANHVRGTSPDPVSGSWMLACANGVDRPFIDEDILALNGTYPRLRNVYVKQVSTLISDDSYLIGCCDDRTLLSNNFKLEFYQDQNLTVPYTTSNNFVVKVFEYSGSSQLTRVFLVPNGATSYDLGTFVTDITYSYGTEVQNNTSGYSIAPFGGYHLAP